MSDYEDIILSESESESENQQLFPKPLKYDVQQVRRNQLYDKVYKKYKTTKKYVKKGYKKVVKYLESE